MRFWKTFQGFIATLFMVSLISCGQNKTEEHCDRLIELSKDEALMGKLDDWVAENIESKRVQRSDLKLGGLKVPGTYYLDSDFDWSMLGFNPEIAQIRLIGPGTRSFRDGEATDIESIFFTELSGFGILVDVNNAGLGLRKEEEKYIHPVSDRVSVLCAEYDR